MSQSDRPTKSTNPMWANPKAPPTANANLAQTTARRRQAAKRQNFGEDPVPISNTPNPRHERRPVSQIRTHQGTPFVRYHASNRLVLITFQPALGLATSLPLLKKETYGRKA